MAVSLSELYETLKEPLGEQGARMVMDFLQNAMLTFATREDLQRLEQRMLTEFRRIDAELQHKADKEDVAELRGELKRVETELRSEIQRVETELRGEIQRVETELRGEIQRVEGEVKRAETEVRGEIQRVETGLRGEIRRLEAEIERRALQETVVHLEGELRRVEAELRSEIKRVETELRAEIASVRREMRFSFALLALLILLTNPKVLELLARLLPFTRA